MGCQKKKRNGKWSWGSKDSDGGGDSDDDGDLQEEDGQASKDEHEEVGNEKGSTAMLEAEKRKPPDISCIFTDIHNDQRYFLLIFTTINPCFNSRLLSMLPKPTAYPRQDMKKSQGFVHWPATRISYCQQQIRIIIWLAPLLTHLSPARLPSHPTSHHPL